MYKIHLAVTSLSLAAGEAHLKSWPICHIRSLWHVEVTRCPFTPSTLTLVTSAAAFPRGCTTDCLKHLAHSDQIATRRSRPQVLLRAKATIPYIWGTGGCRQFSKIGLTFRATTSCVHKQHKQREISPLQGYRSLPSTFDESPRNRRD